MEVKEKIAICVKPYSILSLGTNLLTRCMHFAFILFSSILVRFSIWCHQLRLPKKVCYCGVKGRLPPTRMSLWKTLIWGINKHCTAMPVRRSLVLLFNMEYKISTVVIVSNFHVTLIYPNDLFCIMHALFCLPFILLLVILVASFHASAIWKGIIPVKLLEFHFCGSFCSCARPYFRQTFLSCKA